MAFADTDNLLLIPMSPSGNRGSGTLRRSRGIGSRSVFVADSANESLRKLFDGNGPFGVRDWPGWFSPLVLFGPQGCGKTTLAWTIAGSSFMNGRSGLRLEWTGSDFARAVAEAIDSGTADQLAAQMESAAVIVIDDIHHLERYQAAQNFLVSVLDNLIALQVPLITTLPENPNRTSMLGEALTGRLCSGLTVPVQLPGPAARLEIIGELEKEFQLEIDPAAKLLIVKRFPVSAGMLRRVISTLAVRQQTAGSNAVVDVEMVSGFVRQASQNPEFQHRLIDAVAAQTGVTGKDILGTSRQQSTVMARGVLVYLLRKLFEWSFSGIGGLLNGKDHSTILHAFRKTGNRIGEDSLFAANVLELENRAGELLVNYLPERMENGFSETLDTVTSGKPVDTLLVSVGQGRRS